MTLHRKYAAYIAEHPAVRLSLKDQLYLQRIMEQSIVADNHTATFYATNAALYAQLILERHGVAVAVNEHTGSVTFNPEVIDA